MDLNCGCDTEVPMTQKYAGAETWKREAAGAEEIHPVDKLIRLGLNELGVWTSIAAETQK
jgi:hypothetical protein